MMTIPDLINQLGGNVGFAAIIGAAHPSTASEMKRRRSIPVQHWPRVIAAAHDRGIDLSAESLMAMHTEDREITHPAPLGLGGAASAPADTGTSSRRDGPPSSVGGGGFTVAAE